MKKLDKNWPVRVQPIKKDITNSQSRNTETTSDEFFKTNKDEFDLIYVDGSHEPEDACRDLDNSFKVCKKDAIIWVDDYGSNYKTLHESIDQWLQDHQDYIKIIHKGYQVGFIKLV